MLLFSAVAVVAVAPRWRGVRLWLALAGDGAIDSGARSIFAVPLGPEEVAGPWAPKSWIANFPAGTDEAASRPALLFAHGLTESGIGDERVQRAVHAFGSVGFFVLAPEIAAMRWPSHREPDIEDLATEWRRLAIPSRAPGDVDPTRLGGIGVSLGGALLVRAVAQAVRHGAPPPRALLLVGVPFDLDTLIDGWAGPPLADATEEDRDGHAIARRAILLVAVAELFAGRDAELEALRAWLTAESPPRGEPATDDGGALSFAAFAREPTMESPWLARTREAARKRLAPLSLARHVEDLDALGDVPVFLIHGRDERFVPPEHMDELARRLRGSRPLRSGLLGHVEIKDASLAERWEHVTWIDDFLDRVDP